MHYLYHRAPSEMRGITLYPLNVLRKKHPDLYENYFEKYIGREHLLERTVPPLKCLWNDVLHFVAVHPREIKAALIEAGRKTGFTMEYYEINPEVLDRTKTTVYLYDSANPRDKLGAENFTEFNPHEINRYSNMPAETKSYYREMIASGKSPLLYHRIPHILYRGALDVSSNKVLTV